MVKIEVFTISNIKEIFGSFEKLKIRNSHIEWKCSCAVFPSSNCFCFFDEYIGQDEKEGYFQNVQGEKCSKMSSIFILGGYLSKLRVH